MSHEDALIQQLKQLFPNPATGLGIGDDCAVIPFNDDQAWLLSSDALVEGTHFKHDFISPEQLAYKTVMVNVSDIAAMGGTPHSVLLTLALSPQYSGTWATRFLTQLAQILASLDIHLIGGDSVASQAQTFIDLTILGTAPLAQIKYRHTAKAGDIIAVTKALGGSYAGLQVLLNNWQGKADLCHSQHLTPHAQLAEGQWLSKQDGINAMMDLSDGLATDLPKLCYASQLGYSLNLDQVPIDPAAATLALLNQIRPIDCAYSGGEDYALLVAIDPKAFAIVAQAYQQQFNTPLWPIGRLTANKNQADITFQQQTFQSQLTPFKHFG